MKVHIRLSDVIWGDPICHDGRHVTKKARRMLVPRRSKVSTLKSYERSIIENTIFLRY